MIEKCARCPTIERGGALLEDGRCGKCPMRKLEERFPEEWRARAETWLQLARWSDAGMDLNGIGLTLEDWSAIADIKRWQQVKDLEAMRPHG